MGQVLVGNGLEAEPVLQVGGTAQEIRFSNHFTLLRRLMDLADRCVFTAPSYTRTSAKFFAGLDLKGKQLELITAAKARGDDQLHKPFALTSFGELAQAATGSWPPMHLNNNLHSKIYLFNRDGVPFAGVVTSANLTRSGLNTSHEIGILINDVELLRTLDAVARQDLDYVHLVEHQLKPTRMAVEEYRRIYSAEDADMEVGLANILNRYATPSAGNRDARLTSRARYYIKGVGHEKSSHPARAAPALVGAAWQARLREVARQDSDRGLPPRGRRGGDQCFLSYHVCASAPFERTELEKASDPDYMRWPFYVFGNNLSLHYGHLWFEAPLYVDAIEEEFKREHPQAHVTQAGNDHIKSAIQMGNSYFEVTREFGEIARGKIDAFVIPSKA